MITFAPFLDSATSSGSPHKFATLTSSYTSVLTFDTIKQKSSHIFNKSVQYNKFVFLNLEA